MKKITFKHVALTTLLIIALLITIKTSLASTYIGDRLFNDDKTPMNGADCNLKVYQPNGSLYYDGATDNFDNYYYKLFNITINGNFPYYINCSNTNEYKIKNVMNQNEYSTNACTQNEYCYIGDLLFNDDNTPATTATCNYVLYSSDGLNLSQGATFNVQNYYYNYLNITKFGDYRYLLNCSVGSESTFNYYDVSVVELLSTIVINNNNQQTTNIVNNGGSGGSTTINNYYTNPNYTSLINYNAQNIGSLYSAAGLSPVSNLWSWGFDLNFEQIGYFITQKPQKKFEKSLSLINERESEFFYCVSINDATCAEDVVDELAINQANLKNDLSVMILNKYDTGNYKESLTNYVNKLETLLNEADEGFNKQIIRNIELLKGVN